MHDVHKLRKELPDDQYTDILMSPENGPHVRKALHLASQRRVLVGVDLDGATLKHPPGKHDTHREHNLADHLIKISAHCPAGPITGRPLMFVDTALDGLLNNPGASKAFAATEGGALIIDSTKSIIFQKSVGDVTALKSRFEDAVKKYPGAIFEEHTMCSLIIGLTNVSGLHVDQAYNEIRQMAFNVKDGLDAVGVLHGHHRGVNTHINIVPEGVNKGDALQTIMQQSFAHGMVPILFGDDKPDADMFRVAKECDGVTVGVGPNAPHNSDIILADHHQSQELIKWIAQNVQNLTP